jgi:hypothetical protein
LPLCLPILSRLAVRAKCAADTLAVLPVPGLRIARRSVLAQAYLRQLHGRRADSQPVV